MSAIQRQSFGTTGGRRLELTGCQDVRVAAELHQKLIELLALNEPTTVDCSSVDSFDAAALQLLMSAKRESANSLVIVAPDESEAATWFHMAGVKQRLQPTNLAS